MPKSSTDRAPYGTNIVYKALVEALGRFPEENRKAVAKAAMAKFTESLKSVRAKRTPRKAAAKRRAAPRSRHLNGATETAHQTAA